MSQAFTILEVGEKREWSNDHGAFWAYPLTVEDSAGQKHLGVEWSRKQSSRAPEVGERVVADIQSGPHGEKLKVDFNATKELSGGGSTSSGGSNNYGSKSKEWTPEAERDPERAARILRQHSQEMALRWIANVDARADGEEGSITLAEVFRLADAFDADVIKAAQKAGGGGTGNDPREASPPVDTPGSAQNDAQSNAEYLSKLLEDAGFDAAQVPVVQRYIETQFDNERRTKVEAALKDITTASNAAVALTKEAEAWTGEPLPVHDPASTEIPF